MTSADVDRGAGVVDGSWRHLLELVDNYPAARAASLTYCKDSMSSRPAEGRIQRTALDRVGGRPWLQVAYSRLSM